MTDIKDRDVLRERYQEDFDRNLETIQSTKEKMGKVPAPAKIQEFKNNLKVEETKLVDAKAKNDSIITNFRRFSSASGSNKPAELREVNVSGGGKK